MPPSGPPGRQVYFDAVLLIVGFLLLGKALEARAKRRALACLDSLSRLRPATARRIRDGVEVARSAGRNQPGDSVLVLPGERFPVDATILEGRTTVDESMLTGESTPLPREPGGRVLAGSLNYDGAVTCRAESLGEATVLAQITRMVEQAQGSRAPMERLADRASAIFVPVVLGLAAVTFAVWLLPRTPAAGAGQHGRGARDCLPLRHGSGVPAALTVAVGRGAQLGVLFKGGEALERLAAPRRDCSRQDGNAHRGTAGAGGNCLVHPLAGYRKTICCAWPRAEERSNHPLAHAIVDAARARAHLEASRRCPDSSRPRPHRTRRRPRLPARQRSAVSGVFYRRCRQTMPPPEPGVTRLWMAIDNAAAGCFDARDALRPDAAEAVAPRLRADPACAC
jgi:Cu+-exporting ATPase